MQTFQPTYHVQTHVLLCTMLMFYDLFHLSGTLIIIHISSTFLFSVVYCICHSYILLLERMSDCFLFSSYRISNYTFYYHIISICIEPQEKYVYELFPPLVTFKLDK